MRKLLAAVLLTAALIPATSFGDFETGHRPRGLCKDEMSSANKGVCSGFIEEIVDGHNASVGLDFMEPSFSQPMSVTVGQSEKIVMKYMNENPEKLHFAAASLAQNALYAAFPASHKDGTYYCPE